MRAMHILSATALCCCLPLVPAAEEYDEHNETVIMVIQHDEPAPAEVIAGLQADRRREARHFETLRRRWTMPDDGSREEEVPEPLGAEERRQLQQTIEDLRRDHEGVDRENAKLEARVVDLQEKLRATETELRRDQRRLRSLEKLTRAQDRGAAPVQRKLDASQTERARLEERLQAAQELIAQQREQLRLAGQESRRLERRLAEAEETNVKQRRMMERLLATVESEAREANEAAVTREEEPQEEQGAPLAGEPADRPADEPAGAEPAAEPTGDDASGGDASATDDGDTD